MTPGLNKRFTSHVLDKEQGWKVNAVRDRALDFATWLDENVPDGREKALALTHLEEVVFWSNAGIARS